MKVIINHTVGGYRKGEIVEDTTENLKMLVDRGYATKIKDVSSGSQDKVQPVSLQNDDVESIESVKTSK